MDCVRSQLGIDAHKVLLLLLIFDDIFLCFIVWWLFIYILQFRLAYVAPESRVVGSGDLVDHPRRIALNYLRGHFLIDFFVVLPLPQVWYIYKHVYDVILGFIYPGIVSSIIKSLSYMVLIVRSLLNLNWWKNILLNSDNPQREKFYGIANVWLNEMLMI